MTLSDLSDDEIQRRASWSQARSLRRRASFGEPEMVELVDWPAFRKLPLWIRILFLVGFASSCAILITFVALVLYL